MKIEILTAGNQLVSAALNGVCQGMIVAALVGIGLRLIGRTNAATRHAVWFATLLLLVFIIPAHCLRDQIISDAQDRGAGLARLKAGILPPPRNSHTRRNASPGAE